MPFPDPLIATLIPVSLAAGFIRGFAGFGGPLVMLPILNGFMPPAVSMWVMMWIDILVNVQLLPQARGKIDGGVLGPMLASTLLAMPLGVLLVQMSDPAMMKRIIGASILLASLVLLAGWQYPARKGYGAPALAGLVSGILMGATSLAVPAALFLHARLGPGESRAHFIVWAFVSTVAFLILLVVQGAVAPGYLREIALLAPFYLVGTIAGSRFHARAPEQLVRRLVLLLAAVAGGWSMLA